MAIWQAELEPWRAAKGSYLYWLFEELLSFEFRGFVLKLS